MTGVLLPRHSLTLPGGLERESVWIPLETTYNFETFPSHPPLQLLACVWKGCWVLLPQSWLCSFGIPYKTWELSRLSYVQCNM